MAWYSVSRKKEANTAKKISEIHAQAKAELGMAVLPEHLAKTFQPLTGMKTKAEEVFDLLPALKGGDSGWEVVGKKNKSESNLLDDGKKASQLDVVLGIPTSALLGFPGDPA